MLPGEPCLSTGTHPPNGCNSSLLLAGSDELVVARFGSDSPHEQFDADDGEDWVKFHFHLRGSACYSVAQRPDLMLTGPKAVFGFHGRGIRKSIHVAEGSHFSLTVLCRPRVLIERFGIARAELPSPVLRNLDHGDPDWFAEPASLTPEMIMSLRAVEASPLQGPMLQRYVEARGIELLCDLWSQVGRRAPKPSGPDERLRAKVDRTRDHIDTCFAQPLVMQRLARDAATNQTKLSKAFRDMHGMTIFEYVRSRRMEEARKLLRAGDMSITEIAFEVGYEHSCNFSVAYKRHFGVQPREERGLLNQSGVASVVQVEIDEVEDDCDPPGDPKCHRARHLTGDAPPASPRAPRAPPI